MYVWAGRAGSIRHCAQGSAFSFVFQCNAMSFHSIQFNSIWLQGLWLFASCALSKHTHTHIYNIYICARVCIIVIACVVVDTTPDCGKGSLSLSSRTDPSPSSQGFLSSDRQRKAEGSGGCEACYERQSRALEQWMQGEVR